MSKETNPLENLFSSDEDVEWRPILAVVGLNQTVGGVNALRVPEQAIILTYHILLILTTLNTSQLEVREEYYFPFVHFK